MKAQKRLRGLKEPISRYWDRDFERIVPSGGGWALTLSEKEFIDFIDNDDFWAGGPGPHIALAKTTACHMADEAWAKERKQSDTDFRELVDDLMQPGTRSGPPLSHVGRP